MEKFTTLEGVAAPLRIINVDTDMVIPKQYLKTIKRTGLGKGLFSEMRYKDDGSENPDFVLNKPAYRKAKILVAGDNFGCGSSREHAPWALMDFGIRCVISTSFGDIFYNNCFKNGVLPIRVSPEDLEKLFDDAEPRRQCHAHHRPGETGNPRPRRRHDQVRDRRLPQALHAQRARRYRADQAEAEQDRRATRTRPRPRGRGREDRARAAVCALCAAPSALAQKSTEDGLRDCEKLAAIKIQTGKSGVQEIRNRPRWRRRRQVRRQGRHAIRLDRLSRQGGLSGSAASRPNVALHLPARRRRQVAPFSSTRLPRCNEPNLAPTACHEPAGAASSPTTPLLSIAFFRKPDARTSSMKRLTAASTSGLPFGTMMVCGTPNRLSGKHPQARRVLHQIGQPLAIGAEGVDLLRQQQALDLGRVVVDFDAASPVLNFRFMNSVIESLTRAGDFLPGAVDIGDGADVRILAAPGSSAAPACRFARIPRCRRATARTPRSRYRPRRR